MDSLISYFLYYFIVAFSRNSANEPEQHNKPNKLSGPKKKVIIETNERNLNGENVYSQRRQLLLLVRYTKCASTSTHSYRKQKYQ